IGVWGVGTRLVTAFDQPALGGVYKLAALRPDARSDWQFKLKLSEVPIKTSIAGVLDVARFELDGQVCLDLLYDAGLSEAPRSSRDRVAPWSGTRLHSEQRLDPPATATWRSLLEPALRGGQRVKPPEPLTTVRERARAEIKRLPLSARQHSNTATPVAVGMEAELQRMNQRLKTEALDKQRTR
ncbi:MAG: nicotinate phosphoribosyltransferase, partial [Polyangiaceae bacterium]